MLMTQLLVRNLEEGLVRRLKARARLHGVAVEEEHRRILRQACLRGKGKGSPEYWVARVKPGRIMFEIEGVSETIAREAFDRAAAKLSIQTRLVSRPGEH